MRSVDIIIPVYNAFEDLKICLDSLYKHTDLEQNRLILINDNSPDERIRPFLNKQVKQNVIVIHNETNKGFSNNINIGMSQSDINDVILLNSDTILTSNWVEKMVECAYSSEEIGTVTPLSNNATLCSVPELFKENVLPNGMDVCRAAEIVEQCSLKLYPQISVAHGFCMLVKREVIKLIGNFDAETFGRGYGEENDFCNRAEQMGYIHVMCDNTYIYHSGTKSFVSKEKEKYIREHQKILYDRYPKQMKENDKHVASNPNQLIGENIRRFWAINNGKKNIFYVVQSDFREGAENNVGGTQMHVRHLVNGLRNSNNIFVAAIDGRYLQVTAYIEDKEYVYRFAVGDKAGFFRFKDRKFAKIFKDIYIAFRIDLVHVHHLSTMSLDVIYEADKLNIPTIFTMHDFWSVCPNITLRSVNGSICMKEENNHCRECLAANAKIYEKNAYVELWRKQIHSALCLCKVLIVPSESTGSILGNYYSDLKDKIRVIYHGLDINKQIEFTNKYLRCNDIKLQNYNIKEENENLIFQGRVSFQNPKKTIGNMYVKVESGNKTEFWIPVLLDYTKEFLAYIPVWRLEKGTYTLTLYASGGLNSLYEIKRVSGKLRQPLLDKNRFNIAFIGGINDLKGAREIKEIIEKSDADMRWFIVGEIGSQELSRYENNRLTKVGKYKQESLPLLLKVYKINAIGILSVGPETFSYTLSEALGLGIPFFVTDIGALGERVRKLGVGKKVSVENISEEVLICLREWINHADVYQNEIEKCKHVILKTQDEMCGEYHTLYRENFNQTTESVKLLYNKKFIWNGMADFLGMDNTATNQISEAELKYMQDIQNSISWRIVMKFINIRFPFKDQLYRYLMNRR